MSSHIDNESGPGQEAKFIPAIDPKELRGEYAAERLAGYKVGMLPEQAEATEKLINSLQSPPGLDKAGTLPAAIAEQRREGIKLVGFESDPDFHELDTRLESVFSKELLDSCLIEKITYYPETVVAQVGERFFEIP